MHFVCYLPTWVFLAALNMKTDPYVLEVIPKRIPKTVGIILQVMKNDVALQQAAARISCKAPIIQKTHPRKFLWIVPSKFM